MITSIEALIGDVPDTISLLRRLAGRIGEWLDRYDAGEHHFIVDASIGYASGSASKWNDQNYVQHGVPTGVDGTAF